MSACRAGCGSDPLDCVPDDVVLAQYGEARFRNEPRAAIEKGLSMQIGEWAAEDLCRHIFGTPPEEHLLLAAVRYTKAGDLRARGFSVIHTPGRVGSQKSHVTIAWTTGASDAIASVPWPTSVTTAFDECFNGDMNGGQSDEL